MISVTNEGSCQVKINKKILEQIVLAGPIPTYTPIHFFWKHVQQIHTKKSTKKHTKKLSMGSPHPPTHFLVFLTFHKANVFCLLGI